MKKIKDYLFNKFVDYKLKQLSKVCFIARNDYTSYWNEDGEKTYGRLDMFGTLNYAMFKIYGRNWNFYTRINGLDFTEDENGLYLTIKTHRPGMVIGKMGNRIGELEKVLSLVFLKDTHVNLEETPELYGLEIHENY